MRVLFVCAGFDASAIIAQPWRHSYEIAKHLINKKHETAFVTDTPSTSSLRETTICNIPAYILPKVRSPPVMFSCMDPNAVKSVIKKFSPSVIYWDGSVIIGNYIRRIKDTKIPIIVHISTNIYTIKELRLSIRGFYWSPSYGLFIITSSPLMNPFISLLNQRGIKMITIPNLAIKNRLIKRGILKSKLRVVPTPFYASEISSKESVQDTIETRQILGLDAKDFVVTYFGPPHTYRGTDTIIHAVAKLKRKLPHLKLLMLLRQSSDRKDVFEKILRKLTLRLALYDTVKFKVGILSREDLQKFIQISNVVALPFKFIFHEPPLSVLESMALGKPLITTRVSGLPELVGNDRGLLVEQGNADELAKAIHYVTENLEAGRSLGRRAKEYISKLQDKKNLTEQILGLFNYVTC